MVILFVAVTTGNAQAPESRGIQPILLPNERGQQVQIYNESHALLIGEANYTAGWPRLTGVVNDINQVRRVLETQGFKVEVIIDPDRVRLEQSFNDFIARYGRDPQNRLLFYFAGHGHTLKLPYGGEMGYIVPVDCPNPNIDRDGFLNKAIDMYQVEGYARRILSKHALFIFDCCFSGSIFALSRAVPDVISYKTGLPVRQFITSGSADEKVPDESVFNRQFVAALTGAGDLNRDGFVTGAELGQYLQDKVVNYSRNTQHPQYGTIRDENLDKGDFVFRTVPHEAVPPGPTLPAPPPPDTGKEDFSLEDLKKKAAEQSAVKEQWESWLGKMRTGYSDAQAVEQLGLTAADKALAWQRFIEKYGEDDTFSDEDEAMRQKAQGQLEYWRNYRPPAAPATQTPREYVPGRAGEVTGVPGLRMVPIPGGSFMMGSNDGEGDEKPVHRVTVSSFEMSATEITQAQYRAVMGNNPSHFKGDDLPVEKVSWNDAMEFCRRLSERTSQRYDLPTEAEWEYACRAGTSTKYNTGDSEGDLSRAGWYDGNSGNTNHPVGQKQPNAWGLYDMHGNVWEWCRDWYGSYGGASQTDPAGPSSGWLRIFRGGSWDGDDNNCRSAYRYIFYPFGRYVSIGFRVVRR